MSRTAINRRWQSTSGGNQPAVAINRRWQSTGSGNQLAVAINWQWQSTGSGIHKFGTEVTPCAHYSGSNVAHIGSQCVHCGRCSGDSQSHFRGKNLDCTIGGTGQLPRSHAGWQYSASVVSTKKYAWTLTAMQLKSNDSGRIKKGKSNMYDMQQSRCSNISSSCGKWQQPGSTGLTVSSESDPFANSNEQNTWNSSGGAVGIERKNKSIYNNQPMSSVEAHQQHQHCGAAAKQGDRTSCLALFCWYCQVTCSPPSLFDCCLIIRSNFGLLCRVL